MQPIFPRINSSLYHTREYLKISRIKVQMHRFAGVVNTDYVDSYYDFALKTHKYMEDEINQNIHGSIANVQISMFEFLDGWLSNWELTHGRYENHIEDLIDQDNTETWKEYGEKIEIEEENFRKKAKFSIPHNQQYDLKRPAGSNIFGGYIPPKIETITNSWFYCNDKQPTLIDKKFLTRYLDFIKEIIDSFRQHSEPYLKRYKEGKIHCPNSSAPLISINNSPKALQLSSTEPIPDRLRVSLNVEQLAVLMRLLKNADIINSDKGEIHKFVADHIQTVGKDKERISAANFGKLYSSKDANMINFWLGRLKIMMEDIEGKRKK